tara:strand:- start:16 stop:1509 length:1494 start_codon:yes stop_codon:yes gene_type:complete
MVSLSKKKLSFIVTISLLFVIFFLNRDTSNTFYEDLSTLEALTTRDSVITGELWSEYVSVHEGVEFVAFRGKSLGYSEGGIYFATNIDEVIKLIDADARPMDPNDNNVIDSLKSINLNINLNPNSSPSEIFRYIDETSYSNNLVLSNGDEVLAKYYNIGYFVPDYNDALLPPGYIDHINEDRLLIVGGRGPVLIFDSKDELLEIVDSNLDEIIKQQEYRAIVDDSDISGRMGVRDLFIDSKENKVLISLITRDSNKEDCFGLSIFESDLNSTFIEFNLFFTTNSCIGNVNFQLTGGRIQKYNNQILFSVGSFESDDLSEDNNKIDFGKLLLINKDGSYKIYSSGHRNPQGLFTDNNLIVMSEHGPLGGDEINLIEEGSFYGWPIYNYGIEYDGRDIYKKPHEPFAAEPLKYYTESIAPSELFLYKKNHINYFSNKLLLTTLRATSIYVFDVDFQSKKVRSEEKIMINKRIRDMSVADNGKISMITDDGFLIILSKNE